MTEHTIEELKALTPQERKNMLMALSKERTLISKEIRKVENSCPHTFRKLTKKELDDEWMSESAECIVCRCSFGWRCKVSPDGVCHYFTGDDGKVVMIDGSKVDPVEKIDKQDENDDMCLFCGFPEERK